MNTLAWIIAATILGGVLSVVSAALFSLNTRTQQYLNGMVSYAIGALLGAVFLNILPEAMTLTKNITTLSATVLFGILLFFVLDLHFTSCFFCFFALYYCSCRYYSSHISSCCGHCWSINFSSCY